MMIRDLTKSMLSFSWAMSLFGVEQMVNTLTPQSPGQSAHKAAAAFNAVTQATEAQLGGMLRGMFKAGDQIQRGLVDMTLSFMTLEAFNPSQMMRMTSDMMRQTTEAMGRSFQGSNPGPRPQPSAGPTDSPSEATKASAQGGWGPIPPPGTTPHPQAGWGPTPS
jgi:hypothetical protein